MLMGEEIYVLNLLRSTFGLEGSLPDSVHLDLSYVATIIRRNGILLTVYPQLMKYAPDVQANLQLEYYTSVSQAVSQDYEGNRILAALSEEGLDCIALKGWIMRNLYPHAVMRQMVDIDILVRPYDYTRVLRVMSSLGYHASAEGDSSWKHDNFFFGATGIRNCDAGRC